VGDHPARRRAGGPPSPTGKAGEQGRQPLHDYALAALEYADWIALPKYGPNIRLGTPV
jgi:hypothetical protein